MAYDESTIRDALYRLSQRRFTRLSGGHSSRAAKYRHLLEDTLQVGREEQAVLAVMLLRGPQTPGELLQRTERLFHFPDSAALGGRVDRLMDRELVARYDRRPGQREDRYGHLLGGEAPPAPAARPPRRRHRHRLPATTTGSRSSSARWPSYAPRLPSLVRRLAGPGTSTAAG